VTLFALHSFLQLLDRNLIQKAAAFVQPNIFDNVSTAQGNNVRVLGVDVVDLAVPVHAIELGV
jgi:hypothetical protein